MNIQAACCDVCAIFGPVVPHRQYVYNAKGSLVESGQTLGRHRGLSAFRMQRRMLGGDIAVGCLLHDRHAPMSSNTSNAVRPIVAGRPIAAWQPVAPRRHTRRGMKTRLLFLLCLTIA